LAFSPSLHPHGEHVSPLLNFFVLLRRQPALRALTGNGCFAAMEEGAHHRLLKGVSRSFYLSLRLLPGPMRAAASLAYLLARTSDTLADADTVPVALRLASLDQFSRAMAGAEAAPAWPASLVETLPDPRERALLEASASLFAWLARLPEAEAKLVREVASIILSGQRLDLERFGPADGLRPVPLASEAELEDYAWRVAGCVGAFWTRLGFLTLHDGFSDAPQDLLIGRGIAYGKGLQLVNILRDMPADLSAGRCYLPLADPGDAEQVHVARAHWLDRAHGWIDEGFAYSACLIPRRLRAASVLPAMIARDTLALLQAAGPDAMRTRIKVPRRQVYLAMFRAFAAQGNPSSNNRP
jgi:farnesyl-diphosphate farnesyltransferase